MSWNSAASPWTQIRTSALPSRMGATHLVSADVALVPLLATSVLRGVDVEDPVRASRATIPL